MNERFQIGDNIGDYRIVGFIGMGGMGEVYHAVHNKLGRNVAVKVLGRGSELNESFKKRFINEARLQASLHHPNIATLYDFQEAGNQLYIFMEFVDGECLGNLIEGRAMAVEDACRTFKPIVEAIAYVHANGIVHRDIKDQNIKMTAAGTPKLLDFGIAKDASSLNLTSVGGVIGTPHYLAPEQLIGQPSTSQTDIWALGILLYKMLTGKVPFDAEDLFTLNMQIKAADYTAVERHNKAVPREVVAIIDRTLQREPSARYQTADELLKDVAAFIARRYPQASAPHKPSSSPAGSSSVNRKPILLAAAAALIVLFVGALAGLAYWALRDSGQPGQANSVAAQRTPAANSRNTNPAISSATPAKTGAKPNTIRVDVIEGKAQILRNGQIIGTTPLDIEMQGGEKINLTLQRDGYKDKDVLIEPTVGKKIYTYALIPKN